ncbi:hypothetical protein FOZ62_024979, partial [Perkinsus olseni]
MMVTASLSHYPFQWSSASPKVRVFYSSQVGALLHQPIDHHPTSVEVFTAAGLALGSIFMSTWRVGAGSQYLSGSYVGDIDKNDDQVDDGRLPSGVAVGFPSRLYGLVYVVGNRRQSWLELAESTCDRWETFDASQPLFADAPPCVGKSTGVEKCTRDFNTHLADRCIMYKRMLMLSWC